jgi:nucleotide-binding universal stress UspA family protein
MKILVPHDGSELAGVAVAHALELARASGGEVILFRVVEPAVDAMVADVHDDVEEIDAAQHTLDEVAGVFTGGGVGRANVVVRTGYHPGPAIIDAALEFDCQVIVMSTHGRSGLSRTVMGSVADYVVRHTTGVPVLLCRPPSPAAVAPEHGALAAR